MTVIPSALRFLPGIAAQLAAADCCLAVTGGSGWVGQAALEMLENALGDAFAERVRVFGSRPRDLSLRSGRIVPCHKLAALAELPGERPWIILHFAFLTRDRLGSQSVEQFVEGNRQITDAVAAACRRLPTQGLLAISSGAVYGPDDLAANAYGVMKRREEDCLLALGREMAIPVAIPRLFALSGPFINKLEAYALGSILSAVLENRPIVLRAGHLVERSYLHVGDLLNVSLSAILSCGTPDGPFDACSAQLVEVQELAETARALLGRPELAIERPPVDRTRIDRYTGNPEAFQKLAAKAGLPLAGLEQQIISTADYLRGLCRG